MNSRNLTNPECGQSNPLTQMASHFTQDYTLESRIGGLPTTNNNGNLPPQSFRMNDLMQELSNIDSEGAAKYPAVPSASNEAVALVQPEPLLVERIDNLPSFQPPQHFWVPPMTSFQQGIPQALRSPPQLDPEQISMEFVSENYVRINSLDELKDDQNDNEEVQESNHAQDEHLSKVKTIAELIGMEFESRMIMKRQEAALENSITHLTLLQKGLKLLAKGDLTGAIRCFEIVAKKDKTNVNMWLLLGTSYMKNMQIMEAFGALKEGLRLEPRNLDVIMALAENYANNQDVHETLVTLLTWLMRHPEYKNVVPEDFDLRRSPDGTLHKELINFFIKAAQRRPVDHDYQVQTALGLLMIMNRSYNKADDCFRSALKAKPQDPMLWNQLGISSGKLCKPEEAIEFFNHALSVDPNFLFAKFNIGLILLSKKEFREAAKHFLSILNRQARGRTDGRFFNYTSTKTWNLLHRCISNMSRSDLQKDVFERDLEKLNREFGIL